MKTTLRLLGGLSFLAVVVLSGCTKKSEDPKPVNPQELITRVTVSFTEARQGVTTPSLVLTWSDPDGEGGNAPTITSTGSITAQNNLSYVMAVELRGKESPTAAEEVKNSEITAEAGEHQFFFVQNPAGAFTINTLDRDTNNRPVGLNNTITMAGRTTDLTNFSLRVVLRHELNKAFANLNETNFEQAGGSTDIDVTFTGISLLAPR